MKLDSRIPLSDDDAAALMARFGRVRTLEDVLRLLSAMQQRAALEEVVTQDEYTHDVVVRWPPHYLVFDTT